MLKQKTSQDIEIIVPRTGPGKIIALSIILLIISLGFLAIGILPIALTKTIEMLVLTIIFGGLGVLCLVSSILSFVRMGKNSKIQNPCITYDGNLNTINFVTLKNVKKSIKPSQYIGISHNVMTDFIISIVYINDKGVKTVEKLGYTGNSSAAKTILQQIASNNK